MNVGVKKVLQRLLGVRLVATLLLGRALPVGQLKLHDVLLPLHLMVNVRPCVDRDVHASAAAMLGSGRGVEGGRYDVGGR